MFYYYTKNSIDYFHEHMRHLMNNIRTKNDAIDTLNRMIEDYKDISGDCSQSDKNYLDEVFVDDIIDLAHIMKGGWNYDR